MAKTINIRSMKKVSDSPETLEKDLSTFPGAFESLEKSKSVIGKSRHMVADYQALALYILACQYDHRDCNILEIGTYRGFSASMIIQGAPKAFFIGLEPAPHEQDRACRNLREITEPERFRVFSVLSWKYLSSYGGPELDFIFVDGAHNQIALDLYWWNWLKPGGLILFHDYTPVDGFKPCEPVYNTVNRFLEWLDRPADVLIVDDRKYGMLGIYKKPGDSEFEERFLDEI